MPPNGTPGLYIARSRESKRTRNCVLNMEHRPIGAVPVVVAVVPVVVLLVHPPGLLGGEHINGGVNGRLIADAKG